MTIGSTLSGIFRRAVKNLAGLKAPPWLASSSRL
jgi:hypothetical protein